MLASLGARVIAVDKAPLDPEDRRAPGRRVPPRERLRPRPGRDRAGRLAVAATSSAIRRGCSRLVERWLGSGLARNFVCTLKFQGPTDHATAGRFAAIPGSRLMHLSHNKHELTWVKLAG